MWWWLVGHWVSAARRKLITNSLSAQDCVPENLFKFLTWLGKYSLYFHLQMFFCNPPTNLSVTKSLQKALKKTSKKGLTLCLASKYGLSPDFLQRKI